MISLTDGAQRPHRAMLPNCRKSSPSDRLAMRAETGSPRVHIVLARSSSDEAPPSVPPPMMTRLPEVEVPKVEHDGQWHTLH